MGDSISFSHSPHDELLSSDYESDVSLFGPMNLLQNKIAAVDDKLLSPSPARHNSPRRSPRLGSRASLGPSPLIAAEEDFVDSRPLTPDNEGFIQDEPPSVLASRILQAHGNPSPPPSPDISTDLPTLSLPFPFPVLDSTHSTPSATPPPTEEPLISFEEDTSLPVETDSHIKSRLSTTVLNESLSIPTISISPIHSTIIATETELDSGDYALTPGDVADEQAVIDALVHVHEAGSPAAVSSTEAEAGAEKFADIVDAQDDQSSDAQEPPSTPEQITTHPIVPECSDSSSPQPGLRRSTRPRRSTARYSSPIRAEFNIETDSEAEAEPEPRTRATQPPSPRKTKTISLVPYVHPRTENASPFPSPNPLTLFDQPPPRSRSRSRSPSRKSVHQSRRELGSLSPSSVGILKSLLPADRAPAKDASPLREVCESEPSTGGSAFFIPSLDTPATSAPTDAVDVAPPVFPTPSHTTTTASGVAPPIRFTSPIRTQRSTSPGKNKFQLHPANLDDPSRTPARRIPVQAVGPRLLSSNTGVGSSRLGILTSGSIAAPSPARRVLLHDSGSGTISPAKKPPPLPTLTSTQTSSPTRSRSRSVEPNPKSAPAPTPSLIMKKRSGTVELIPSRARTSPSPFSGGSRARSTSVERERVLPPNQSHSEPHGLQGLHPAIPETDEGGNSGISASSSTSGQKSSMHQYQSLYPTIPEEDMGSSTKSRSTGKQPTSKIPRIGMKPYARPTASSSKNKVEKHQQQGLGGASSSTSSIKPKALKTSSHGKSAIPISSPVKQQRLLPPSTPTAASLNLKRKRGPEISIASTSSVSSSLSSSGSPTKSPTKSVSVPIVLLPAPKRHASGPSPTKKAPLLRMVSESDGVLPSRSTGKVNSHSAEAITGPLMTAKPLAKMRLVGESDGVLPDRLAPSGAPANAASSGLSSSGRSEPEFQAVAEEVGVEVEERTLDVFPPIVTATSTILFPPEIVVDTPSSDIPVRDDEALNPASATAPAPVPEEVIIPDSSPQVMSSPLDFSEFTFRRTTRSSRNASASTPDSNPNSFSARSSRPASRRKTPAANIPVFFDPTPFSGMTALALRTLTDSNTTRNKEYLTALLKTEVVRREGARPESPGMNVKSISQKEEEAKEKERSARAERRAKREGSKGRTEVDENGGGENGIGNGNNNESENGWDSSPESSRKHVWGPGDEEDYETPLRPMKRLRLDDHDPESTGEEESEEKRRVKWDRGLYSQIYLDEIKPRSTHARIARESIKKGCLAPTAKALRLDTLGNLPNADSPLKDLVQENIVVKKFVYDSDAIVEPEPVGPPPTTRSKSKRKSKS